ncbi:Eco57I restriction-modification methylase domain-containing protein [Clostridium tyrobutyricum]|uniref:Eco57I restriction-modification methylase domain-containing protein n=1 Tax=Clostridium tyrobutyricum TaxID=1519 RepID=UPI00057EE0E9|nr:Eco57I restriction-modification methylase domain-containing protein [Clostridium tyrobutyricum]
MDQLELYRLFNDSQEKYLVNKSKKYLKTTSQFFTPHNIAVKMLDTIDKNYINSLNSIRILEPSAGCGILILEAVLYIIKNSNIKKIIIDAYEISEDLSKILKNNLKYLKKYLDNNTKVSLKTLIYNKNFILKNSSKWNSKNIKNRYNLIISNPPFKKINKTSEEAIALNEIVFGQPNIYTLFIALCLKLLLPNGIYTLISPRNYLIGMYTEKLRKFIFNNYTLKNLHTFDNRNIFKLTNQEIIISTFINNKNEKINISHNGKFEYNSSLDELLYDKENYSIFIPKNKHDILLIKKSSNFRYKLNDLNILLSVGPIVQFRNTEYLSSKIYSNNFAPLLVCRDLLENKIIYYERKNTLKTHNKSINVKAKNLIPNSNYLLLQKVTAKNDRNPIITTVLKKGYFKHRLLGLDNNILYFHNIDKHKDLPIDICYGLFCYINSNYFNQLYSLINGNHTINVSDFKNIRFPSLITIKSMGNKLISLNKFDKDTCSKVLKNCCSTMI